MIKIFKSNKFISILLIIVCIIIIFNPSIYAKSCLNGISVWAFKVLPLMFPFLVLTKAISSLTNPKENIMDKFFKKVYGAPNGSFLTFFLSVLSGYPMGAKLICSLYQNKQISSNQAQKMMSFCSISGPMFIIGTVGVSMLYSFRAGVIILLSNIFASLINGLIYRNKDLNYQPINKITTTKNKFYLTEYINDSLSSILMIGAYIILSFILVDILKNTGVITFITNTICGVFNLNKHHNVVQSTINGFIEITRGIFDLSQTNISLKIKTIISSFLIAFSGLSIMMQSLSFLDEIKMPFKTLFLQKITQSLICLIITIPLAVLFL